MPLVIIGRRRGSPKKDSGRPSDRNPGQCNIRFHQRPARCAVLDVLHGRKMFHGDTVAVAPFRPFDQGLLCARIVAIRTQNEKSPPCPRGGILNDFSEGQASSPPPMESISGPRGEVLAGRRNFFSLALRSNRSSYKSAQPFLTRDIPVEFCPISVNQRREGVVGLRITELAFAKISFTKRPSHAYPNE